MLRKPPRLPKPKSLATKHRAKKPKGPIAVPAFDTRLGNVEGHSYSPETGQLTIIFRGGRRYSYTGVPEDIAIGMDTAESRGAYLHANIIGKYEHARLDDKTD